MSAEVAVSQVESNLTVESANHVEDIESPAEENGDKQHEVEETTNENQQDNDSDDSESDESINIELNPIVGPTSINLQQNRKSSQEVRALQVEVTKVIPNPEIDALVDKPWQKPGSDLSDYFNYGFTESSWRLYSERQRNIRDRAAQISRSRGSFLQAPPGKSPSKQEPNQMRAILSSNPPPVIHAGGGPRGPPNQHNRMSARVKQEYPGHGDKRSAPPRMPAGPPPPGIRPGMQGMPPMPMGMGFPPGMPMGMPGMPPRPGLPMPSGIPPFSGFPPRPGMPGMPPGMPPMPPMSGMPPGMPGMPPMPPGSHRPLGSNPEVKQERLDVKQERLDERTDNRFDSRERRNFERPKSDSRPQEGRDGADRNRDVTADYRSSSRSRRPSRDRDERTQSTRRDDRDERGRRDDRSEAERPARNASRRSDRDRSRDRSTRDRRSRSRSRDRDRKRRR